MVFAAFITAHAVFYVFVGCKVYCVRRTCDCVNRCDMKCGVCMIAPAPTITLETPLHNALPPSALDIVAIALDMPVYTAAGVGLMTCILVLRRSTGYL